MASPLTGQQIINKFHLYTGDQSELSTQDELDLLNKVYDDVLNTRPWEFLKKSVSGSILTDAIGAYIPLPADFRYFIENNQKTDNADTTFNNASPKVIFVGPNFTPYQIVNYSDRRQFRTSSGFCYPDLANNVIRFTVAPTESTYEFDYIYNWSALTLATSPLFPADFHDMLYQLMSVDSTIINLFDRAHSYAPENQKAADDMMRKLVYWNSMQTFN
jgi:hypothetical protein